MAGSLTRTGDSDELEMSHEINVTPFIDVMLVLLIIFMVAAPLATVDVNVDLPASTAKPQPHPDKPLFLTVKSDLSLALGDDPVTRANLDAALDDLTKGDRKARIFLRADKSVSYGDLMGVMNLLRDGGYLKVALVGLETASPGRTAGAEAAAAGAQARGAPALPQPVNGAGASK
ncbi:MAG TPA: TonB system transport protein ExbD [Pararhizobium sp.]|nr:TonB system transport protein ExbD [Pararhizobium sp.]